MPSPVAEKIQQRDDSIVIVQNSSQANDIDEDESLDKTLDSFYDIEAEQDAEQDLDAVILSGIEAKLATLNRRRRAERVAAFCHSGARGDIEKLARSIKNGVHVDETDSNGRTALHCASSEGRVRNQCIS